MIKVAIVGKGTSSIITALQCLKDGFSVDIYYDPETPYLNIGESTTLSVSNLIHEVLGISACDLYEQGIASLKNGVKFIDWGVGNTFYSNFYNKLSFQFNTEKFNPYIHDLLEQRGVNYIPHKITHYHEDERTVTIEDKVYDFIIWCSGWNEDNEYKSPFFRTVDSAILYKEDSVDIDSTYSIHRATEDGWQFGLPFPKDGITKCGYLYDSGISNPQVEGKRFSWTPKYSKHLIKNNTTAYNGNRLFFLEPLQALSLHYYGIFAIFICDYIKNRDYEHYCIINHSYQHEMWNYQMSLAFHYRYGSIYNSLFWKNIVKSAKLVMNLPSGDIETHEEYINQDLSLGGDSFFSKIGIFKAEDLKQIHFGMTK